MSWVPLLLVGVLVFAYLTWRTVAQVATRVSTVDRTVGALIVKLHETNTLLLHSLIQQTGCERINIMRTGERNDEYVLRSTYKDGRVAQAYQDGRIEVQQDQNSIIRP